MSRIRGEKLTKEFELTKPIGFRPYISWLNKTHEYSILVPDMYELMRNGNLTPQIVRISEPDIYRLINADKHEGFSFDAEKGDLDDDTYLGISYVQHFYYLSMHVLNVAKRESRKWHYPQKCFLKLRIPRGGRPIGAKTQFSDEEWARIDEVYASREQIKENCYRHDWADEYVELMKDVCRHERKAVISRKQALRNFTVERRKWLEENS